MAFFLLGGSVGTGRSKKHIPHNQPHDVAKVRDRLLKLGFRQVSGTRRGDERDFVDTIRVFQGLCKGEGSVYDERRRRHTEDGRIDLEKKTHQWLAANNAPKWVKIDGLRGPGWRKTDEYQHGVDSAGYCSSWLLDAIKAAGKHYQNNYRSTHDDYPPMWIMDCAGRNGGNVGGHASHETGIDVDMRLPLLPPDTDLWTNLGRNGFTMTDQFYEDASLAQLKSIKAAMNPQFVLFQWPVAVRQGLSNADRRRHHDQHYHIRIKPPTKKDGIYSVVRGDWYVSPRIRRTA